MKKFVKLIISILIPVGVGFLSSLFTKNADVIYENLNTPSFSPPALTFPIVWTILYILMGISAYLVYTKGGKGKSEALKIYAVQLILNFFWSIIFFKLQLYPSALVWIIVLLYSIYHMIKAFYNQNKLAGLLQIPYFLWVAFATILNLCIVVLN